MTVKDLTDILKLDKPSIEIKNNEKEIFELIPELEICKGFDQKNEWHPYDVYEHTLHVVDNVDNNEILRMSALFHDIGKPETFTEDEYGVGHFYGHWKISKRIFLDFAFRNNINNKKRETISKLIYFHDKNLGKLDDNSIDEIAYIFTPKELELLYKLKKADLLAQNEKYHFLLDEYEKQEKVYKLLYGRMDENE